MRTLFAFCLSFLLLPAWAQAEPETISWSQLVDESARDFEDPFKALSVSDLSDLSTVVRLRERLKSEEVASDARPRLLERLRLKEDSLEAEGIDIEWLLSQRWIVAEKRQASAWASNPDLDGRDVTIRGFLLLGRFPEGEGPAAYLVPEAGMCSHMPPPPPNQLLRLELPEGSEFPNGLYAPVELKGHLDRSHSDRAVHVVDGIVPMRSAWALEVTKMTAFSRTARNTSSDTPKWPRTVNQQ